MQRGDTAQCPEESIDHVLRGVHVCVKPVHVKGPGYPGNVVGRCGGRVPGLADIGEMRVRVMVAGPGGVDWSDNKAVFPRQNQA